MESEDKDCDMTDLSVAVIYLLKYVGQRQTPCCPILDGLSHKVKIELKKQIEMNKKVRHDLDRYKWLLSISKRNEEDSNLNLDEFRHKYFTCEKKENKFVAEIKRLKNELEQLGIKNRILSEKLRNKMENHDAAKKKIDESFSKEQHRHDSYVSELEKKYQDCQNKIIEMNLKRERGIQEKERQLYQQNVKLQKNISEKDAIITSKETNNKRLQQQIKELETKIESSLQGKRELNDFAGRHKLLEKQIENLSDEIEIAFNHLSDTDMQLNEVLSSLNKKAVTMVRCDVTNYKQDTDRKAYDQHFNWNEIALSLKNKVESIHSIIENKNLALKSIEVVENIELSDTYRTQRTTGRDTFEEGMGYNDDKKVISEQLDRTKAELSKLHELLERKNYEVTLLTHEKSGLEKTIEENDKVYQEQTNQLNHQQHDVDKKIEIEICLQKRIADLEQELDKNEKEMEDKSRQYESAVKKNIVNEKKLTELQEAMNLTLFKVQGKEEENDQFLTKLRNELKERDIRISELSNDVNQLSQRETHIKKHGIEIETELNCLKSELEIKEQNINELEEKIRNISDAFSSLKRDHDSLTDELDEKKEELQRQDAQLYQTTNMLKDSNERVSMFEKKHDHMEDILLKHDKKIKDLESQRNELIGTNEHNEKSLKEKNQHISELNKIILQSNVNITDLKEYVLSLDKALQNNDGKVTLLETELRQYTNKSVKNKEKINQMESVVIALEKEAQVKDDKLNEIKTVLKQNLKQSQEMQMKYESIRSEKENIFQNMNKEIEQREAKVHALEQLLAVKSSDQPDRTDYNEIKAMKKEMRDLKKQLNSTLSKLHDTEAELDETKTRLSKAMGDRLTDNNPNITDLSDSNRPTKLAEKCAELYDNQWTDAFDVLQKYFQTDEAVIEALLQILQETMTFCQRNANDQIQEIGLALNFEDKHVTARSAYLSPALCKMVKDIRKASVTSAVGNLLKMYISNLRQSREHTLNKALEIEDFTSECLELCWLMMINDPPVAFAPLIEKGAVFDYDLYKPYTKSGAQVEYVVWPSLLLHEGGPVLAKGVAQGFGQTKK